MSRDDVVKLRYAVGGKGVWTTLLPVCLGREGEYRCDVAVVRVVIIKVGIGTRG